MDELSQIQASRRPSCSTLEQELIDRADLVFTGGSSLYEAKKDRHHSVHCFPSSVDRAHFAKARARQFDPADQEELPRPRLGFYGVIDERFDIELLDRDRRNAPRLVVRDGRPGGQDLRRTTCRGGPTSIISAARPTTQLPAYLAGWDVALMPFAMNESTAVHLADQDARISRRRQAGGVDPGQGRRAPLRPARRRADRRRRGRASSPPARRRSSWPRTAAATGSPRPTCCCRRPAGTRPRRAWPA